MSPYSNGQARTSHRACRAKARWAAAGRPQILDRDMQGRLRMDGRLAPAGRGWICAGRGWIDGMQSQQQVDCRDRQRVDCGDRVVADCDG